MTYTITHLINGGETTEFSEHEAASIGEALAMAERSEAGARNVTFGIQPTDYAEAREAGIEFNEADGLLL